MAQPYSTRFWAVQNVIGDPAVSYTCPAGKVAILRDVDCWSGAVTVGQFFIKHTPSNSQAIVMDIGLNGAGFFQWQGRFVFYAGESISLNAPNHIDCNAGGFLLDV